ncbi:YbdD/YjiX family protein [Dokdonella sp.]|uniref:YbdD/YjiX family protein n=1 Tax=Dokdonella sp. TaxID=2291710 RepID=UPI003C4097F1
MGRGYRAQSFLAGWTRAVQIARRCIGVPDYDTYLCHLREHHPDRVPMSYPEFFVERQNARYKGGGGRCC